MSETPLKEEGRAIAAPALEWAVIMFMGKMKGTAGRSLDSQRVIPAICFTPREAEKEQALAGGVAGEGLFQRKE